MALISSIRSIIKSNIWLYDLCISGASLKFNKNIESAIQEIYSIDSISEYSSFKQAVIALKKKFQHTNWLGTIKLGGDSLLYGHLNALADYANYAYKDELRLLLPSIEHGISWLDSPAQNDKKPYLHSLVSQGAYRHQALRLNRKIPHYIIGPYIHYASPFFNKDDQQQLKKKLGKVLLVFPAHTYEDSSASYTRKDYVNAVINQFGNNFDTILVSAYWNDVDDELFDLFEKSGAHIVSSGLRSDIHFIQRLKHLITLSDAVTGNALGTHIGYSVYLNKPFIFFEGNQSVQIKEPSCYTEISSVDFSQTGKKSIVDEVKDVFSLNEQSLRTQKKLNFYEKYWGGSSAIKTPEEIRAIFDIQKDLLQFSKGFCSKFDQTYLQLLNRYFIVEGQNSLKGKILEEALK